MSLAPDCAVEFAAQPPGQPALDASKGWDGTPVDAAHRQQSMVRLGKSTTAGKDRRTAGIRGFPRPCGNVAQMAREAGQGRAGRAISYRPHHPAGRRFDSGHSHQGIDALFLQSNPAKGKEGMTARKRRALWECSSVWQSGGDEGRAGRLISLTGTTTQQVAGSIPAIPARVPDNPKRPKPGKRALLGTGEHGVIENRRQFGKTNDARRASPVAASGAIKGGAVP